ncbi:MAG: two-component regulator propeller domain-containing protein [Siphonobacter sp.]
MIYCLLPFLVLGSQLLRAQKLSFEYLTVKDGLPQSTVRSIVKDAYGFMWFGTWNGLCRYDGYTFRVYRNIPGDSTSIANNRIHYIYKDPKGVLWIATFNSIICRYNELTDNFTRFKQNQLPAAIRNAVDRQQNIVAIERSADLIRRYVGNFRFSQTRESIVFQNIPNQQGGIDDQNVNCVYKDNNDILWLGTATRGINKVDLNAKRFRFSTLTPGQQRLINTPARAIWADSLGVWVGSREDGLTYINPKNNVVKHFTRELASLNVRAIFKDSYGDVWIGNRAGLDKYDGHTGKIVNYFKEKPGEPVKNYRFFAIAEDPVDQSVWFFTFNGILKYNRQSRMFNELPIKHHFARSGAGCLFFDSKRNLWIGTEYAGLFQIKRNPTTQQWTDTVRYSTDGQHPQLPDERVYSVTEDETGSIWAGTANGLCRIDPQTKQVNVYTRQGGLSDQYIARLLPDGQGNIWISHKQGISKLNVRSNRIRNYEVKEGQVYEFMDGAGCVDAHTGELYFGSIDGFVSFHPKEIIDNPYLPVIALTELQILNKPVQVGQAINDRVVLNQPLHLTRKITLTHQDRSFSIEFAALHYTSPEKNQYMYRLEGVDADWILADASRRVATYANLPPGTYHFAVKASNGDGVWNPVPARLDVVVLPPWWRTGWAYGVYLCLLLGVVYLVYRLICTRQAYNQQILTERLKAEKALELDELKSRFFTNISHEFRTPLTLIIDPLESLLNRQLSQAQVRSYYTIMHRNANRLLRLINQFLDYRKLESGTTPLRVSHQNLVLFIRQVMSAFTFQAQQRRIQFTFETTVQELVFGFDTDVVEKILYNLLSNAFKYTNEGGQICVTFSSSQVGYVEITVTDNGVGISPEQIEQIFDPFYQADNHERSGMAGTGIGLSLTKELVKLHGGIIKVRSIPSVETCFTVTLRQLIGQDTTTTTDTYSLPPQLADVTTANTQPQQSPSETIVLVVEDNEDIRCYIKLNLGKDYHVIEAAGGWEGYEKAIETIPDLIISDVMMPGLNGLDLCRRLKTDEKTSHIPIILLTARQSEQAQMEGYETGADAYIAKPFNSSLLRVRIKTLIESRQKLRQLFSASTGFDTRLIATNAMDKAFVSKATKLIEDNLTNGNFNAEWLAEQLSLSRTQLFRKIKALTNQSVHEFVTTIRLNKAATFLLESQLTVAEIAFLVGYADSTIFGRNFQKQFGQTPKKFSQQIKTSLP